MITLLLIWLGICIALMTVGMRHRQSAGLPLAYFLGLSLIHTPGALLHVDSNHWDSTTKWTQIGFEQTVIGMAAFLCGVIVARNIVLAPVHRAQRSDGRANDLSALNRLALLYFGVGALSFMAMQFVGRIPSVGAIIASLFSLMIVGVCLRMWVATKSGDLLKWGATAALLPLFPLVTLLKDGFIGFGTYWLLAVICFVSNQSGRKIVYYLLAPAVVFIGLSVFVNYMASRHNFRQFVWQEQAGLGDRIQRMVSMFDNFQFVDFSNAKHSDAIDGRLNQNILVGLAVERLDSGGVAYASGATIGDILIGLIPRAIWPEKPYVGGGGTVVTSFTGVQFAEGTSVGAGQVLEFYINFGTSGVIGGFLLYGWLIGKMDLLVINCLNGGDQKGFVLWFPMCLALLQPGGNLLEIVVTVASSAIAGKGIGHFLLSRSGAACSSGGGIQFIRRRQ